MDKSVEIDEITDILVSLEFCAFSLTQLHKSERAWKWAIISLHSALQGAMVCHLSGRLLIGFQEEKTAKKSLERFVRNPADREHSFRLNVNTDSGSS